MNWGEIQIESLKKMFLNNDVLDVSKLGSVYKTDKRYKTYLDSMPQACNEAIEYILENGKPIIKQFELIKTENTNNYDLKSLIPDFKRVSKIIFEESQPIFHIEGDSILVVNGWNSGKCNIYYESYPEEIKSSTSIEKNTGLDRKYARLIPLYIAGELMKDDDLRLATMYMNEFINNVAALSNKDFNQYNSGIESIYTMM